MKNVSQATTMATALGTTLFLPVIIRLPGALPT